MTKKTMTLVGLAAVAYFLFMRKGNASAAPRPAPAAQPGGSSLIDLGSKAAEDLLKFGTGLAKEKLGMEGMAPATLNGHMASLGAFGDLGGSFYGGY